MLPATQRRCLSFETRPKRMSYLGIIALTPAVSSECSLNTQIAAAAAQAGALGVLDLELVEDRIACLAALQQLRHQSGSGIGIRIGADRSDDLAAAVAVLKDCDSRTCVILTCSASHLSAARLARAVKTVKDAGATALVEAVCLAEALQAEKAGACAVVATGNEAGSRVGEETAFVLFQRCAARLEIPVWVRGGIGLRTAAACRAGQAAGVVLDSQLLLATESPLAPAVKAVIARLDGSETTVVSSEISRRRGEGYRVFTRPGSQVANSLALQLAEVDRQLPGDGPGYSRGAPDPYLALWRQTVACALRRRSDHGDKTFFPLGQDVVMAGPLARKYATVGGIIQAVRLAAEEHIATALGNNPLAAGSPLAEAHGTVYPIVQGAMTRVSDNADFARAVATGGALPFLALALMRKSDCEKLLSETKEKLGGAAWGVGILGFVPRQLRQEQLEVIGKHRPPFALIAGGRPDQARQLEDQGINTYLHVPSPLLLSSFLEAGARRFVFEGRECGGHVGPRSSFVLWESMLETLDRAIDSGVRASDLSILLAGGIHDDLSATMVSALVAPLAKRGVRIGVLMGTAYLFTAEAVDTGAIVPGFQQQALANDTTVLFETGPGHSIRCLNSPYRQLFDQRRQELERKGRARDQIREELELMNLGRLRIASKGIERAINPQTGVSELVSVPEGKQWQDGMYMAGQVAALHRQSTTIGQLHEAVSAGSSRRLSELQVASRSGLPAIVESRLPSSAWLAFFPRHPISMPTGITSSPA